MKQHIKRWLVGTGGGILLLIGIIAIPYPGPGWAIVFAALALLATEFTWAQTALDYLKQKYASWQKFIQTQHPSVRVGLWVMTGLIVVVTIWLLNGYGYMADIFELDIPWAESPLPWL